jgi:serine/threonine protein kinase
MAESRTAQDPSDAAPAPAGPGLVTDLFAGGNGEHGNDAPTIISKAPPQPGRVEDTVGGTLRGRKLAHFELIEPIGVGGMAAVIRARDLHLDRSVALKILPPEMAADPENVRRFHQEARAAARLDHENIARVFFCGEDQRLHFIAFEFVEGENLRVLLERRGRLPVAEAIHYMLQVATGLAHASARNVVHRDIKPSNIIVTANGRAKLVDMGLARSQGPHSDNGLTQSGVTLGTFDYISPEQALEPRDADVRSDIYSLGCTFYHMLTGQPPVPEGTAARKLHHHQHVAPVDPRQLNPAIPDDVAAILARMMAKDPKDRYQRAEHLVQHLIQVAQKLGAISEAPDGVLFVDAPLPGPPRKRPVMMAALAVIALTALVAVLSLAPTESLHGTQSGDGHETPAAAAADGGGAAKSDIKKGDKDTPEPEGDVSVSTVQQLADALTNKQVRRIVLRDDLTVTPEDNDAAGLVCKDNPERPNLVIESLDPKRPVTIRVAYSARSERGLPWTGLTFLGGSVTLRNLRFEVEIEGQPPAVADLGLTALAFGRGKFQVEKCTFAQKNFALPSAARPDPPLPVASVAVRGSGKDQPELAFKDCYFESGQAAVALTGAATIKAESCAFGPHAALFHLRGRSGLSDTTLQLTNCSAFVVDGPAFRLDDEAACRLVVRHSVFSRPTDGLSSTGGPQPDLICQMNSDGRNVCYVGQRNAYHNLNAYWVRPSRGKHNEPFSDYGDFDKFQREVRMVPDGNDQGSEALPKEDSPWDSANPLDKSDLREMFRLKVMKREVRTRDGGLMLGVQRLRGDLLYDHLPPLQDKKPVVVAKKRVKVVDPKDPTGDGVYHTLAAAIADAEPGDEIQIKSNGEVPVNPDKAVVNLPLLTIKPYAGYRPVLALDEKTIQREAALFRLHDGKVVFERLEFLLKPNPEFEYQTLVEVMGNGSCTFKQCVLTLPEGDKDPADKRPSVVRLTDPGKAMKTGPQPTRSAPEIRFEDCLVRGQGNLVAVLPSRPLDLEVTNAVVALDGCLLAVDGTAKDPPAASTSGSTNQVVRLANVTAYLTEPLLHLRAKDGGKGLVGTAVRKASDCLFVAAGDKPLIELDGADSRDQMMRLVEWQEGRHNAYVRFDKMLSYPPHSSGTYYQEQWRKADNVKDLEAKFFDKGRKIDKPLSQVVAKDFRGMGAGGARGEMQKYGPDVDKLPLPTPQEASEPEKDGEEGG